MLLRRTQRAKALPQQRRRLQQGGAYQFYLPPEARRRGQAYPGGGARVERLAAKLLAGERKARQGMCTARRAQLPLTLT